MTETTPKALIFGAGLFIALALIAIAVNVFSPATEAAKASTTDFSAATTELKDQKYLIYDNTTISGSQVVNAIRKFESEGKIGNISIKVITGTGSTTSYYNTFDGQTISAVGTKPTNVNDSTHTEYINPSGMFKAEVKRDKNSVIRSVVFKQDTLN